MTKKAIKETVEHDASGLHEIAQEAEHASGGHNPLAQFEVKSIFDINIGGFDLSLTNSALYMILATFFTIAFFHFATKKKHLVPTKLQLIAEGFYNFVSNMVLSSVGKEGAKFVPFVFSLFSFILLCNVLGITPYAFTATSQVAVTLSLALLSILTVIIFAIYRNGIGGFFHMFLPSGVPLWMAPFIFAIEFFSFLIRPLTLSVRLFANMVAGHVLLKVVAGFVISLGVIIGVFPFLFSVLMTGFELFVAVLQAYIFAILVCAYLGETVRSH